MQNPDQKYLQALIEDILTNGFQNLQANADEIIKLLSIRVDMPKHFITIVSKRLSIKQQQKISLLFDILWFVTEKYDNKIVFFNQINGNKQFLFKIQSLLSLKELKENVKIKIIDIVYQWNQMFKNSRDLFPSFWNFYSYFEKKGYTPSNMNFKTRYQQQNQHQNVDVVTNNQQSSENKEKNIFDMIGNEQDELDFGRIQHNALHTFYTLLKKLITQNKIISTTSPDIFDLPPVIKQNMSTIKIAQDTINKYILSHYTNRFIGQHKNPLTVSIAMQLIKSIHLTQKRYTQLITRYLPQKFQLSEKLVLLDEYCRKNQVLLGLNYQTVKSNVDLMSLDHNNEKNDQKKGMSDLLDLGQQNEMRSNNQQKTIKNFFGNLLDKVNTPPKQVELSNKPIQNDFATDMDLLGYQDPKTMREHYDKIRNLTAQDLFKF